MDPLTSGKDETDKSLSRQAEASRQDNFKLRLLSLGGVGPMGSGSVLLEPGEDTPHTPHPVPVQYQASLPRTRTTD